MISRRGFLKSILALGAGPAIVRLGSLMPLYIPSLILWGDGKHDDADAINALLAGKRIKHLGVFLQVPNDAIVLLPSGIYSVTKTLLIPEGRSAEIHGSKFISTAPGPFLTHKGTHCNMSHCRISTESPFPSFMEIT